MVEVSKNSRAVKGWVMYDWANSAYALVVLTAIFPDVFKYFAGDAPVVFNIEFVSSGSLYSFIMSFSFLILMIITPVLGAYSDQYGRKRRMMIVFTSIGSFACFLLAYFDSSMLWMGVLGTVLGTIGFSGSLVFYNAFLPEIAPKEDQDKVSARGYALGYIGSVLLLIGILVASTIHESLGFDSALDVFRSSFIWVGIWWFGFACYTFVRLPKKEKIIAVKQGPFRAAISGLKKSWSSIQTIHGGRLYLLTFFSLSVGLKAILLLAPIVAIELVMMSSMELVYVVLILQILAVFGAYILSRVASKKGNIIALMITGFLFVIVCVGAFFIQSKMLFYILAVLVGFAMGGMQTLLRSSYSKMIYECENHAALFSYYDWLEKVASLVGTGIFALVAQFSSDLTSIQPERIAMLSLSFFFIAGLFLLSRLVKIKIQV